MNDCANMNFDQIYLNQTELLILEQSVFPREIRTQNLSRSFTSQFSLNKKDVFEDSNFMGWKRDKIESINRLRYLGFIAGAKEREDIMGSAYEDKMDIPILIAPLFLGDMPDYVFVRTTYLGMTYLYYCQNKKKENENMSHFLETRYQAEQDHIANKQAATPVFNIQNAYGAVFGSGNQTTINYNFTISEMKKAVSADTSSDKEQLKKIVSLLEMVVNDQVPPSKGLFSKFRDVMERNSWITGSIANALISWLLTKTL